MIRTRAASRSIQISSSTSEKSRMARPAAMKCATRAATSPPTSGFDGQAMATDTHRHRVCQRDMPAVTTNRRALGNHDGAAFDKLEDEPVPDACASFGAAFPVTCHYGGRIACSAWLLAGWVVQLNGMAPRTGGSRRRAFFFFVSPACVIEVSVKGHG